MLIEKAPPVAEEAWAPVSVGSAMRRYSWLKIWVALTDVLALLIALALARIIRTGWHPVPAKVNLLVALAPFLLLAVFASFRLFKLSHLSPAEEFSRITWAVTTFLGILTAFGFWAKADYSRAWLALAWVLMLLFVMSFRRFWHMWMHRARQRGTLAFRTLVVGANEEAERLIRVISPPYIGYRVVGRVSTGNGHPRAEGVRSLGDLSDLSRAIAETRAECLFVASSAVSPQQMALVTKAARVHKAELRVSANISDILSTRLTIHPVGGVMMALSLKPVLLTGVQAAAKRILDLVLGTIALVVSVPAWLVIAIAIKLDSRGPVLYQQDRVGRHGRRFRIVKFRTMVDGAHDQRDGLRDLNEASGPLFKLRRDPRVTRVGKFLRKTSLDELPQILNVLKGEMSLVGPRPALPDEVGRYEDWHLDRLEVPPGITGLWQVRGRSNVPFDDYVRLDLFYIENWSVTFDLYIIAKTIPAMFTGRGAF